MINFFRIGKIITVHGIKGEIKIFPTTDDIKRFNELKKFYISKNDEASDDEINTESMYFVENVKYVKNMPILKISNCDTIEEASKLIGNSIYVSREDAIALEENEFYISDIIGADIIYNDKIIAKVKDILQNSANDILIFEINNKEILIPMVDEYILSVNASNKKIYLKNIEGFIWKFL